MIFEKLLQPNSLCKATGSDLQLGSLMAQRAQSHEGYCVSSVAQKKKRNSNTCKEHKKTPKRELCNAYSYHHESSETPRKGVKTETIKVDTSRRTRALRQITSSHKYNAKSNLSCFILFDFMTVTSWVSMCSHIKLQCNMTSRCG
jgi:hypothetical protein